MVTRGESECRRDVDAVERVLPECDRLLCGRPVRLGRSLANAHRTVERQGLGDRAESERESSTQLKYAKHLARGGVLERNQLLRGRLLDLSLLQHPDRALGRQDVEDRQEPESIGRDECRECSRERLVREPYALLRGWPVRVQYN